MKKITIAFGMAAFLGIIYVSIGNAQEKSIPLQDQMELVVEPGENWFSKMKLFLFVSKTNTPQLAAWIEDDDGNYISTLAVTEKSVNGKWIAAPKEGRPEALPVWNHKQHNFSVSKDVDTVSSASIKSSLKASIDKGTLNDGKIYNVFLEVNHSFNYNSYWTKDNSGVNGQPSLVYHAQFTAGQKENVSLVPIGYGSVDGSNGTITRELENLTSALNIVGNACIVWK